MTERTRRRALIQSRKLRIIKPPLPAMGICEHCNCRLRSSKTSQDEADAEIRAAFDAHECKTIETAVTQ
jgi:hypothetical protein